MNMKHVKYILVVWIMGIAGKRVSVYGSDILAGGGGGGTYQLTQECFGEPH